MVCWHLIRLRNIANYFFLLLEKKYIWKYTQWETQTFIFKTCTFTHISVQSRDRFELNKMIMLINEAKMPITLPLKFVAQANPGQQQHQQVHALRIFCIFCSFKSSVCIYYNFFSQSYRSLVCWEKKTVHNFNVAAINVCIHSFFLMSLQTCKNRLQ